jgi:ribosomal protein L34E
MAHGAWVSKKSKRKGRLETCPHCGMPLDDTGAKRNGSSSRAGALATRAKAAAPMVAAAAVGAVATAATAVGLRKRD